MTLLLIVLAVFPGLFISWFIWKRDKYEKEPHRYLIACFLFGILSVVPAIILESFGMSIGYGISQNPFNTFIFAFIVIALSEEFSKYLFLRYYIFPKDEFCEPMDGIVYSVMVSMGFATFENFTYVFSQPTEDLALNVAILRMLMAVPGHASFAVIMGYFVGKAKFSRKNRDKLLIKALLGATVSHGLYDFFLMQQMEEALAILTILTLIISIFLGRKMIKNHLDASPHKIAIIRKEKK